MRSFGVLPTKNQAVICPCILGIVKHSAKSVSSKKSGSDVEAHVRRECDALVAIVEKRKGELLGAVNMEYQAKLDELRDIINKYEQALGRAAGLAEFTREALKEDNPATFLQVTTTTKTTTRATTTTTTATFPLQSCR